ncbi:hypothetical protein FACS1894105_05480 [Clostridia bacterium]|nr:hypothetical protein FACS1894105_05480 [Clostridia bacterium]
MNGFNNHGGSRHGAGRPRKTLTEAIAHEKDKKRIKKIRFDGEEFLNADTPTIPEVTAYLRESQRGGEALLAADFFRDIWIWLKDRSCEKLFDKHFLERFALQQARCVQIESQISKLGFLAKNQKGDAAVSPLEILLQLRMKELDKMQNFIAVLVRENCTEKYDGDTDYDDPMEQLLREEKGK